MSNDTFIVEQLIGIKESLKIIAEYAAYELKHKKDCEITPEKLETMREAIRSGEIFNIPNRVKL